MLLRDATYTNQSNNSSLQGMNVAVAGIPKTIDKYVYRIGIPISLVFVLLTSLLFSDFAVMWTTLIVLLDSRAPWKQHK
jgi:hypothetical protein